MVVKQLQSYRRPTALLDTTSNESRRRSQLSSKYNILRFKAPSLRRMRSMLADPAASLPAWNNVSPQ